MWIDLFSRFSAMSIQPAWNNGKIGHLELTFLFWQAILYAGWVLPCVYIPVLCCGHCAARTAEVASEAVTRTPREESSGVERISMVLVDLTKQVADIKERVTFNTQLLQDIARQHKRNINKDKIQLPCDLPLNTYKDILAVEQNLKSKEFYSQLVWLYFIYFSVIADLLILCHYFVLHYIIGHSQIMQHRIKVSRSLVKVRGISLFIWWQAPL